MSWFDATGFANLAKSALKEAQKTIDKALDIKDDENEPSKKKISQVCADDTTDFFATWGLRNDERASIQETNTTQRQQTTSSIWGSFTGSFFETPKLGDSDVSKSTMHSLQVTPTESEHSHRLISSLSLPESLADQDVNEKPLKVDVTYSDHPKKSNGHNQNFDKNSSVKASSNSQLEVFQEANSSYKDSKTSIEKLHESDSSTVEKHKGHPEATSYDLTIDNIGHLDPVSNREGDDSQGSSTESKLETDRKDINVNANYTLNRLSIVSCENDKKSLESVEILGSQSNTDCTTTPESDMNSVSNSLSPSAVGPKVNSESVEILPDSLVTSPSSVEILGDWISDSSPYLSPLDPKYSNTSSVLDRDESVTPCGDDGLHIAEDKQCTVEASSSDVSPYESPMEEVKTLNSCSVSADTTPSPSVSYSSHINKNFTGTESCKVSPESVEVIPDVDELDEVSLAEDSYTSASESTVMTIMETLQQFDQIKPKVELTEMTMKMHDSYPNGKQILVKASPDAQLNLSLDSLKEKHALHLPIQPITTQPFRKVEQLEPSKKLELNPFNRIINTTTIEPFDTDCTSENEQTQKVEAQECVDQCMMLTDSSCEGTLIESSSEENATLMCKSESKVLDVPLSNSSYVKTMLADAMVDKTELSDLEVHSIDIPRENSPISSESRSDLVKIGSDQTSGHTSGDELETTTSSDIEIISSPNGDSSSTQSRQSPAKLQLVKSSDLLTKTLKTRGHSRELSEISIGSDDTNLEIEKLLRRIQEITEILEARESKLIDVSRMNMELNEQNNNLKKQLDSFEKHAEQNQNLNQIADEYTQRLSALERKFQQAIRERDSLRKSLEQVKQEAATRLSSQEISTINAEKDEIIKELREEGETLSKQQLQHSNIIKKLRIKEKENEHTIKNIKEQLEEQSMELERLKRSLHAKEEVERTQIEAVHTLTAKTKKQDKEIFTLQEKLDNSLHKMEVYKRSLDAAKVDLIETKKSLSATEKELKETIDSAGESCQLLAQVEGLKLKLRHAEEAHVKREEVLKHENNELLKRLEAAETRSEELSESVSVATKPLLRQLEQLQTNLLHKTNNFMKQEKVLSDKNIELQTKLESVIEMDRSLKEDNINLKSKLSTLESKLNSKEIEAKKLEGVHKQLTMKHDKLVEQNIQQQQMLETMEQSYHNQLKELKREINALENKLAVEKAATDAEKRKNHAILEQQQSIEEELRLSPTLSIGRESISSVNSVWQAINDSVFENPPGRFPMICEGIRAGSSSASMIESLQAQLKQRDGEIQQLQWELSRRNVERDALNSELSTLTLKIEDLNNKVLQLQTVNERLNEIQTRYDALLQMYGEKVEENQELRLDLEDIKEMYKSQIDQLLKRDV